MCGGGGGGGNPVTQIVETVTDTVSDAVSDATPDLKIITEDIPTLDEIKEKVSDETPDIKIDTDNLTTLDEIKDTVSNVTPDIKIIPEDLNKILPSAEAVSELGAKISSGTPDLIIDTSGLTNLTENIATGITDTSAVVGETLGGITTDILQGDLGTVLTDAGNTIGDFLTNPLGTTQEILDHNLGDTGLKGAIDQTVEFVQNPNKVINKAKDRLDDFIEGTKEEVTGTVEDYQEVVTDIGETAEEIGEVATETLTTGMETVAQLGDNAATQVTEAKEDLLNALVEAGLLTRRPPEEEGVGNAQAIMAGDPRMLSLMARRNRARKRGKAQLRKGGGLYIPVGTGLQVPA